MFWVKIKALVFDAIDKRQAYHLALGTTYFSSLVKHLISQDRVEGLLARTIQAERWSDAARLVKSYALAHALRPASAAIAELDSTASGRYMTKLL